MLIKYIPQNVTRNSEFHGQSLFGVNKPFHQIYRNPNINNWNRYSLRYDINAIKFDLNDSTINNYRKNIVQELYNSKNITLDTRLFYKRDIIGNIDYIAQTTSNK